MTTGETHPAARAYEPSPMRTFWLALTASVLVLGILAWAIGKYGVNAPVVAVGDIKEAWSVNVAIWSLAITSVVSIAGSITAIAIANSANQAQKQSSRLQEIEVYHAHPAYRKALRIVDAHLATKATLQLILTGLNESRRHALVTATANPWPMINRWKSFSSDLHRSVFESELYAYLLSRTTRNPQLVPWAVATILSTAAELETMAGAKRTADGSEAPQPSGDSINRALFERNALAYIAAGKLLGLLGRSPSIEELYRHFGGTEPVPYRQAGPVRDPGDSAAGNLGAIRALTSECLIRFKERFQLPVWDPGLAAEQLAGSLRDHFDEESREALRDEQPFTPHVMVDVYAPFVAEAIESGLAAACRPSQAPNGPRIPAVADRVVRIANIEDCLDHAGPIPIVAMDVLSLPKLMDELGDSTQRSLDEIATALAENNRNTLFVFTSSNELRQAELFYLASKLPRSVIVWEGWPYIPNEGVAVSQLLDSQYFSTATGSRGFRMTAPIIFTGTLPLFQDPLEVQVNTTTDKVRGRAKLFAVADLR